MSPAKGEKLIEVKGLEKHFKHVEVLRGINIDICKGDVVAVIGPSGSGKSTFLRCLNLLEEPTGGQIVFEGVDITSKETKIDQMRQKIGMVFQQFNLFTNMTVLDNVSAGPVLVKGMKRDEAHCNLFCFRYSGENSSLYPYNAIWYALLNALLPCFL